MDCGYYCARCAQEKLKEAYAGSWRKIKDDSYLHETYKCWRCPDKIEYAVHVEIHKDPKISKDKTA